MGGVVSDEHRPGHYRDHQGHWQHDRRLKGSDRRHAESAPERKERRTRGRRTSDQDMVDREHREMIREALDDFTAEKDD